MGTVDSIDELGVKTKDPEHGENEDVNSQIDQDVTPKTFHKVSVTSKVTSEIEKFTVKSEEKQSADPQGSSHKLVNESRNKPVLLVAIVLLLSVVIISTIQCIQRNLLGNRA